MADSAASVICCSASVLAESTHTAVVSVEVIGSGVGLGAGAGESTTCTSPANTDMKSTHVKLSVIARRFMNVAPLEIDDARFLTSARIKQQPEFLARGGSVN